MSEPNYPGYTLDELYDARDHIDRGSYPGRYRLILEEIERRDAGADEAATETAAPRPVFPLARVTLGILVLAIVGAAVAFVVLGPEYFILLKDIRPIQQAVVREFPGQRIEVSIEPEDAGHRIVVVMIDSKYSRSSQRRKEKAREIARLALGSHPRQDEVIEIVVTYREAVGSDAANLATDRSYRYAPDELDVEPAAP